MEVWLDVNGYEGIYQVSSLGNIRSLDRERHGRRYKGKQMKTPLDSKGYPYVCLMGKTFRIHQLMAVAFFKHKPNKYELVIDHVDGNRANNRLDNLQLVTQRVNFLKRTKNTKSKYDGVIWDKERNSWQVRPFINGKYIFIGRFDCETKAHLEYLKAVGLNK